MRVIGAGMAGLLAAGMLRKDCKAVLEAKASLPDNHSAVLRFRSSIVGDTLNIPFKKVRAVKASLPWRNSIADMMAYSRKTNGEYTLRSIASANGEQVERYIAPPDFLDRMVAAVQAPIRFNHKWTGANDGGTPTISTLPMPVLMRMLNYEGPTPTFQSRAGYSLRAKIQNCNMFCSLYVPNPGFAPYRISITGDELIAEVVSSEQATGHHQRMWMDQVLDLMGLDASELSSIELKAQPFMKILPIDEQARKKFIMWASDKHSIFSLGRFATWRPGLLLDDLVNDVRVIQRIAASGNYDHRGK